MALWNLFGKTASEPEKNRAKADKLYRKGIAGQKAHDPAALADLEQAAAMGHLEAQMYLGKLFRKRNPEKALRYYAMAGEQGSQAALKCCVLLCSEEWAEEKQGIYWQEKLALSGDVNAQWDCGEYYLRLGGEENARRAMDWYEMAAEQGHTAAQAYCGEAYLMGSHGKTDLKKGRMWLEKAAAQRDPDALRLLEYASKKETFGSAAEKTAEELLEMGVAARLIGDKGWALPLLTASAEQGNPKAMWHCGNMFRDHGPLHDDDKALRWYQKAAKQGNVEAMLSCAEIYEGRDILMSRLYYELAAEHYHPAAGYYCANLYRYHGGTEEDLKQAVSLYERSALLGESRSVWELIGLYSEGTEIPQDLDRAMAWCQMSIDRGVRPEEALEIKRRLELEKGTEMLREAIVNMRNQGPMDEEDEWLWFLLACEIGENPEQEILVLETMLCLAEHGSEKIRHRAEVKCAEYYLHGKGTDVDLEKAFTFFERSAQGGLPEGMFYLALMYDSQCPDQQSYEKAAHWFEKAAERRVPEAQYNLAVYYYYGKGVSRNREKARYWLEKLAEQGNNEELAAKARESLIFD